MRWVLGLALLVGCDDGGRARDPVDSVDAGLPDGAADMADLDDGITPDVGPDAAGDGAPPDATIDVELPPDAAPIPEDCNGEDDDLDGQIDEGVANVCGGCGGIPADGCQAWRIDLTQSARGTLIPDRTVGLLGGALGSSEVDIDNATCTFVRVPAQHPDGHLGQVNIDAPGASLNLGPVYDERQGFHRYLNTPELGPTQLHEPGDEVAVRTGGGRFVGAFMEQVEAPDIVADLAEDDLLPVMAQARGESAEDVTLTWTPASPNHAGTLRFFVGGSVPVFTNVVYRGIRHYQLDGVLVDDGELVVPADIFAGGVPESAIRVNVTRERTRRRVLGPHAVQIRVGNEVESSMAGRLEADGEPPFQIVTPSPNDRIVIPGEPLEVTWSELPEGEGPLLLTLTTYDSEALEQRQYTCTVTDPALGAVTLPGDFTEAWPRARDDFRQLSLRWDRVTRTLPEPDRGSITESLSLLLRLDGCQEDPQCGGPGFICDRGGCREGCRDDEECTDGLVCGPTQLCMAP